MTNILCLLNSSTSISWLAQTPQVANAMKEYPQAVVLN